MTLAQLYDRISSTPWTSWISHGVLAGLIVLLFGVHWIAVFYVLRELEQLGLEVLYRQPVDLRDHIMDALVPVAVVLILWRLGV